MLTTRAHTKGGPGKKPVQRAICCPCGNFKLVARGLCASCYTLKRHDRLYFGGMREAVLARDSRRCRVCRARGCGKRKIAVHHRVRGQSALNLLISLCPACHARVSRTLLVRKPMPPLLMELWREQHPDGYVQGVLEFPDYDMPTVIERPERSALPASALPPKRRVVAARSDQRTFAVAASS